MSSLKKIKSALISVYHKERVDEIVKKLDQLGVKIYSTGGTKSFIEELGVKVNSVESLTSYPSILGGRVKTLHPKVFGGILARRENENDIAQLAEYEIPEIDLVIVDLYPFEATVASGAAHTDIIEKIDIGGISLIRAAAKNYKDVIIVPSRDNYDQLLDLLESKNGESDIDDRKQFALMAFACSSHYDTAIFNYFNQGKEDLFRSSYNTSSVLRYGENPHQRGVFYGNIDDIFDKIHGKEISYNNLLDIDAAVNLIDEFDETTFAILKHNNACGCASREKLIDAWKDALAGDPVSAFGGILITNTEVDADTALEINKLFFEVIIAPAYDAKALEIFKSKKNRIVLIRKNVELPGAQFRSVLNGVLYQDRDLKNEQAADLTPVTKVQPDANQTDDLLFANKLVKQSKSNTIVLAKNKQLLASGVGETSRVDALKHAIEKAESFGFDLKGAVMSSDAFFPFADCVEIANGVGVKCVIQPGGSIRDQDSIDFCNDNNMAMVFTGTRHFKH
ncbi:MAG TPA: bifunctional phosphoribosylaminoimidazolecarboxamide formyltransferase/IMP cyclohydrolase [Prolixibacteraceae bacterium]|nr:bifunctional phosphoribosylaminoimidazolecarboxamide formyltransferase/IMP cyclohydrolase [Prolixibacteraceae bacterium]HPR59540.1 bifunctional phosphoribosylaminoimidazolecarboxamide formyltransferase/IMP cyclohydrolase [Prolixibacteraceae bacterium]